jgi:hypothetical protein
MPEVKQHSAAAREVCAYVMDRTRDKLPVLESTVIEIWERHTHAGEQQVRLVGAEWALVTIQAIANSSWDNGMGWGEALEIYEVASAALKKLRGQP